MPHLPDELFFARKSYPAPHQQARPAKVAEAPRAKNPFISTISMYRYLADPKDVNEALWGNAEGPPWAVKS